MEINEFSKKIKESFNTIAININDEQIKAFYNYMELLSEWNNKVNLTAIVEPDEVIIKHFLDSVTILKHIGNTDKVIDVGTGAGFPGIPINIINNCDMTLMDSLNKRITFLREVVKELKLKNISLVHSRAEDLANDNAHREAYDIAVSRAVAPLNVLLEYVLPFVKVGGKFICMKGPNIEEIKGADKALKVLGGEIEKIEEIELGEENIKRNIIIIKKAKPISEQFPRKAGTPNKQPIV